MLIDKTALETLAELIGSEERAREIIEGRVVALTAAARRSIGIMHECERVLIAKLGDRKAPTKRWNKSFLDYMAAMDSIAELTGDRNEARRLIAERMN